MIQSIDLALLVTIIVVVETQTPEFPFIFIILSFALIHLIHHPPLVFTLLVCTYFIYLFKVENNTCSPPWTILIPLAIAGS